MEKDPRVDPRDVLRGKCTKCDCLQYNCAGLLAACSYCQCPPTVHEKVDEPSQNMISVPVTQSISLEADHTSLHMYVSINTPSKTSNNSQQVLCIVPNQLDMPGTSVTGNQVTANEAIVLRTPENSLENFLNNAEEEISSDDIPMPAVLPDYVNAALETKMLDARHRSAICRAVVHRCINEGKATNMHLKKAADRIRAKYSPMKKKLDPNGAALYKKLVRTRNRINNPGSKKSPKPATAALSEAEAQQAMVIDWASNKRSVTVMAPYLETSRKKRNKEAKKSKSLDLLIQYPALTIPQLLLLEFAEMDDVKVSVLSMKESWLKKLPFIIKYLREASIYNIGDDFSVEQQTVMVLENIHRVPLFLKGKSKNFLETRSCRVLEIFAENTPIAEARPDVRDPLRLSGIGNAMGNCSFFAYSDSEPIFTTENSIEAILLLLATYWVFHLDFKTANKLPILFLSACILGPLKIRAYISRNEKFLDFCRDKFDMIV